MAGVNRLSVEANRWSVPLCLSGVFFLQILLRLTLRSGRKYIAAVFKRGDSSVGTRIRQVAEKAVAYPWNRKKLSVKFIFLELTNICNFDCSFCPEGILTRKKIFMDKALAFRLIDEIAKKKLTSEPLQLHLMGEPLLHPQIFEIIAHIREKQHPIRLFTNGSTLSPKNRDRIYSSGVEELVIGIQTPSEQSYIKHRGAKISYAHYSEQIWAMITEKFKNRSGLKIHIQYLNTKSFNQVRLAKDYSSSQNIGLVDNDEEALELIARWKKFGLEIAAMYCSGFLPIDLEGVQGEFRDHPLDCHTHGHCEILPGVILSFKSISPFADWLMKNVRFVERYKTKCSYMDEQLGILADGECTICCVDYDGKINVGNVTHSSIEEILNSKKRKEFQNINKQDMLPLEICRTCMAFLVSDDYSKKFFKSNSSVFPFQLIQGWYNLEGREEESFRWMGKRAIIKLEVNISFVEWTVKNAHPVINEFQISISQGAYCEEFTLKDREWQRIRFKPAPMNLEGDEIVIETQHFFIPEQIDRSLKDKRELGLMVRNISLS